VVDFLPMQELLVVGVGAVSCELRTPRRAWVPEETMGTKASKMAGKGSKPAAKGGLLAN